MHNTRLSQNVQPLTLSMWLRERHSGVFRGFLHKWKDILLSFPEVSTNGLQQQHEQQTAKTVEPHHIHHHVMWQLPANYVITTEVIHSLLATHLLRFHKKITNANTYKERADGWTGSLSITFTMPNSSQHEPL
jgi:hypothetical protein